jgi:hypothetical protein
MLQTEAYLLIVNYDPEHLQYRLQVYHLLETLGAYPIRKHLKGAPIGLTLALPSNSKT